MARTWLATPSRASLSRVWVMRNWLAASSVAFIRSMQVVLFGDALRCLMAVAAQTAIQALVAGIVEHAEHAALHAGLAAPRRTAP